LSGHESLVHFSANSDVRCTLMTVTRSERAALRCQKTHLKIKRVVVGVRILDDVNHLTDIYHCSFHINKCTEWDTTL